MELEKKTIKMLVNAKGKGGMRLVAGKTYELPVDSADHHLKRGNAVHVGDEGDTGAPKSAPEEADEGADATGMTVAELKDALTAAGVTIPSGAKKAELQELFDANVK